MSRYAPILWLALWPQIVVALPGVEQPVEGFARLVWASNEGEYGSNRGTQVASSWEYAQDGTQAVVWESAPVPQGYTRGFVTFAWSCGLARQEEAHGLYLNDVKILSFNSGLMVKPTSWEEGDFALRFEPVMKDAAGDVHGVMYLRVPAATVHSGKPVVLKVGGTEGGGSWFMLHHFEDTYAQAQSILALPSGRRLVIAPPRTLFLAPGQIGWSCPFALVEGEDFPADVIHLQARLKKDADELSLEQQLRIQPDQRQVELALWSAAETSAGDWEITLTFSGADGVELLRWQSEISVRDLSAFDELTQRSEALIARLETDESLAPFLREVSLPSLAYAVTQIRQETASWLHVRDLQTHYAGLLERVRRVEREARRGAGGPPGGRWR